MSNMLIDAVNEDVMSKLLVTDDLWGIVEPLLPKHEADRIIRS